MYLDERISRAATFRLTVHSSALGVVENCCVGPEGPGPSGYEPGYQIVLPYHGLFSYFTGKRGWLIDATRTLCISPGWDFREEKPVGGIGHAAILINPALELVDEMCGSRAAQTNVAFTHASLPSSRRLQLLAHMLLRQPLEVEQSLLKDEWMVSALASLQPPRLSRRRASRVIDRAKEALHAYSGERLSLSQVATLVGVSPVYLTQEFTRSEGLPLYQYQLQLRLNQALLELPHCGDITELALDLGFSSHSHFSAVFRKAFGMTPSQYRLGVPGQEQIRHIAAGSLNGSRTSERRRAA